MDDLHIGDTVAHIGSGRRAVVVELGTTWYGTSIARVHFHAPAGGIEEREVPVGALRKINQSGEGTS